MLTFLFLAFVSILVGFLIVLLPQFLVVVFLFVLPALKRQLPWLERKPEQTITTPEEAEYIQTERVGEDSFWMSALLAHIFGIMNKQIEKIFFDFIAGEIEDLKKEVPGCFLINTKLDSATIGPSLPIFSNWTIVPNPEDPTRGDDFDEEKEPVKLRVTVDLEFTGDYSLCLSTELYKIGIPIVANVIIKHIKAKLYLEFSTLPEKTISFALWQNFEHDIEADIRVGGRCFEFLNWAIVKVVLVILSKKLVVPRLKTKYLMEELNVLRAGYLYHASTHRSYMGTKTTGFELLWVELKYGAMTLLTSHVTDKPERSIDMAKVLKVEISEEFNYKHCLVFKMKDEDDLLFATERKEELLGWFSVAENILKEHNAAQFERQEYLLLRKDQRSKENIPFEDENSIHLSSTMPEVQVKTGKINSKGIKQTAQAKQIRDQIKVLNKRIKEDRSRLIEIQKSKETCDSLELLAVFDKETDRIHASVKQNLETIAMMRKSMVASEASKSVAASDNKSNRLVEGDSGDGLSNVSNSGGNVARLTKSSVQQSSNKLMATNSSDNTQLKTIYSSTSVKST